MGDSMKEKKEEGVYIISVAARLGAVHPQTLRLYERKGLLYPERTPKNRRRYSESDIERLKHIQGLTRKEGLNLSGVRKVLGMEDEISRLRDTVMELEAEIADARLRMAEEVRNRKKQSALRKKPPTGLVLMRRKGSRR